VRAHRGGAVPARRSAPLPRGALRRPRRLPGTGAARRGRHGRGPLPAGPRRGRGGGARRGALGLRLPALTPPLIECHAHVLPDAALARFPEGSHPRYVTAERCVLSRMLEAQAAAGVTHALVSDSFFMESAAEALPSWSPLDRVRLYNDTLAALIAALHERFTRIPRSRRASACGWTSSPPRSTWPRGPAC